MVTFNILSGFPRYKFFDLVSGFFRSPTLFLQALSGKDASQIRLKEIDELLSGEPLGVIEAGAFDGADTEKMSHHWGTANIFSFEPIPELFEKLDQRVKALSNVETFQFALVGNEVESVLINTFSFTDKEHGSSSILEPGYHKVVSPSVQFNRKVHVPALTLDKWKKLNPDSCVDVLWLDLQGAELDVLKGGIELLKSIKLVHVEVSRRPLYEGGVTLNEMDLFLSRLGFKRVLTRIPVISGNAVYTRLTPKSTNKS
jgi:FkbM family methyltransferase